MSIRVMTQVWDFGPEDATERFVLLAMADIADDFGVCWPSVDTIGKRCCMSERNARRIIRKLEDAGWVTTEMFPGRNKSNRYTIRKPDTAMSARTDCPPGQIEHENRTKPAQKPDTAMSAEPSRTIKEPSKSDAREKLVLILSEVASERAARDFVDHRRAKRAPMTEKAARMIADDLRGHPAPDKVIDASIKNGWTGVFPDRVQAPAARLFDLSKFKG